MMLNTTKRSTESTPEKQACPQGMKTVCETIDFTLSPETRKRDTNFVIELIARGLNVHRDSIALLVLDPQGKHLHFLAPDHLESLRAKLAFTRFSAPASRALWERNPLIEDVILPCPRPELAHVFKRRGGVSLCYPVLLDNCPLGVIQVTKQKTAGATDLPGFDRSHIATLKELETSVSKCFQSARAQRFTRPGSSRAL